MSLPIRIGLFSGFASMLFLTLLYVSDKQLLVLGYERLTLLIIGAAMFYVAYKSRKSAINNLNIGQLEKIDESLGDENFISFSELINYCFKTYLIAFTVKFLFVYFLFNYYDMELVDMVKEVAVEIFKAQRLDSETDMIFNAKLNAFKNEDFSPKLTDIGGIAFELILGFIISLIIAFLLRRDKPEY